MMKGTIRTSIVDYEMIKAVPEFSQSKNFDLPASLVAAGDGSK